uniref:Uncharacterized protein n=1 Tax=Glycine max TaxID=3847 RepID=K7MTT8_SOYBN
MLTPTTGVPKRRPRSGRTPLQLKNTPADPIHPSAKPKPKPKPYFEISLIDKENNPVAAVAVLVAQPPETSLAEELSAVKKKLERMRADKEKTEKMLNEKHAILDAKMKEMEERGEIQKNLEIEVDRLFRLKELKYRCMVRATTTSHFLFDSFFKFDFSMLIFLFIGTESFSDENA